MSDNKNEKMGNILEALLKGMSSGGSSREKLYYRDLHQLVTRAPEDLFGTCMFNAASLKSAYIDAAVGITKDKEAYLKSKKEFKECFEAAYESLTSLRKEYKKWVQCSVKTDDEDN